MLVLARKIGQQIMIGDSIVVTVIGIRAGQVRLGIEAPGHVVIHRQEIYDALAAERRPDESAGHREQTGSIE